MRHLKTGIFAKDRGGNVILIYALALPVLAVAVGIAVDFGRAAQMRSKLNAIADAAALAALTPSMMDQTNSVATAAATAMFNGQTAGMIGLAAAPTVAVTVTTPSGNNLLRNVTVCYTAYEQTMFAGALGVSTLAVANCASATGQMSPNIDFYVLLDNSPSMALPATQAGINKMQSLTLKQETGGCAFACHQASTNNGDTAGNPCSDGSSPTQSSGAYCSSSHLPQIDNYQLARNNSITLRIDELSSGLTTLMTLAQSISASSPTAPQPTYRFAVNTMDSLWKIGFTNVMSLTSGYVSGWASAKSNFGVMEMYANNEVCATSSCSSNGGVGDVETNYDNALSNANSQLPSPGQGSNVSGDSPQEVLFFVTDGVEDELSGSTRLIQQINANNGTNYCDTIKRRGIKIAILYTEYLPTPNNSFYNSTVAKFQTNIGPALQACATSGLFYDATVNTDLGAAMSALFQKVVSGPTLTN